MGGPDDIRTCAACGLRGFQKVNPTPLTELQMLQWTATELQQYHTTEEALRQHYCVHTQLLPPHRTCCPAVSM